MRAVIAAAMVIALTSAAGAQGFGLSMPERKKDPVKEMKDEDIDRAYRDTTRRSGTGAVAGPSDPWASVRGAEHPAKPAPKAAAKPKAQTQAQAKTQQAQPQAQPQAQGQSPWPAAPAAANAQAQSSPWPAAPTTR